MIIFLAGCLVLQGFNTLVSFPLLYQGMDPGFTFNSVFNMTATPVNAPTVGTTCSSVMNTALLYNGAAIHAAAAGNMNIPSTYLQAAFTQNLDFQDMAGNAATNQLVTIPTTTTVTVGGWSVNTAAASLDTNYIEAVVNLAQNLNGPNYASYLTQFAKS